MALFTVGEESALAEMGDSALYVKRISILALSVHTPRHYAFYDYTASAEIRR